VAGTTASRKLEARRLQMLKKQREKLEDEVKLLENEVKALVRVYSLVKNINDTILNEQELKVLNQ
jgi:hypothetical protein